LRFAAEKVFISFSSAFSFTAENGNAFSVGLYIIESWSKVNNWTLKRSKTVEVIFANKKRKLTATLLSGQSGFGSGGSQVGANPIPTPLIWRYLGVK